MAKRIHSKRTTTEHLPPALGRNGRAWSRMVTDQAIKKGIIRRQPCKVCGAKRVHAHHQDYSKPLEIIWLCHQHHVEAHGKRWRPEPRKPPKPVIKVMVTFDAEAIGPIDAAAAASFVRRAEWVRIAAPNAAGLINSVVARPVTLEAARVAAPVPKATQRPSNAVYAATPGSVERTRLVSSFDPDAPEGGPMCEQARKEISG